MCFVIIHTFEDISRYGNPAQHLYIKGTHLRFGFPSPTCSESTTTLSVFRLFFVVVCSIDLESFTADSNLAGQATALY